MVKFEIRVLKPLFQEISLFSQPINETFKEKEIVQIIKILKWRNGSLYGKFKKFYMKIPKDLREEDDL